MNESIYFDYNATTPIAAEVLDAMMPYFTTHYGNASSNSHPLAWASAAGITNAREQVARLFNCDPTEIIFTSGATESINLSLWGMLNSNSGLTLITSNIEHAATHEVAEEIRRRMGSVIYLPAEKNGLVAIEKIEETLKATKGPKLLSLILANNEIGSLYNIKTLSDVCRRHDTFLHLDATQAILTEPLDLEKTPVDLMSFSGHKIYGPKGVGALYLNKETIGHQLKPIVQGGGQELGLRSGTLNTPGIVGLGEACHLIRLRQKEDRKQFRSLYDLCIDMLNKTDVKFRLNGDQNQRIFHNISITLLNYRKLDPLILTLTPFCLSQGSACGSQALNTSSNRILKGIGLGETEIENTLRISLGRPSSALDLEKLVEKMARIV